MQKKRTVTTGLAAGIAVLLLVAAPPANAVAVGGNSIYEVSVVDGSSGSSYGSWTAATGAGHPVGADRDLLYFWPSTSFSSLRIYGDGDGVASDYTFAGAGGGIDLDPFYTGHAASSLGPGVTSTWSVTPEDLNIVQDVFVTGSTYGNSAIYHTVEIINAGNHARRIGWRNLYDWQVNDPGTDDGPNNQIEKTDGTVVVAATTTEFAHTPGDDELVRVSVDPGVPSYQPLLPLGFDPGFVGGLPVTTPDLYAYVSWPSSFGTAFDYTLGPVDVTGDSAGLSWFGRTSDSAYEIGAGQSVRFTQAIFGVIPEDAPPGNAPGNGSATIPEPVTASLGLLGMGMLAFAVRRRRV